MREEFNIRVVFSPEENPNTSLFHDFKVQAYPSFHPGEIVTLHCQHEDHREPPVPNNNFINRRWEKFEVIRVDHIFTQQNIIYDDKDGVIIRADTVRVIVKPAP